MKTMNKTLAWLCAAVLTLTLVSGANAETGKRTGKVVRVKGDARYSTGNKIWQPLKVGTIIQSGNVVQTAPNSFVDIVVNQDETAATVTVKPVSTIGSPASGGGGGAGGVATPDQDVIRVLDDTYLVFDSLTATATGSEAVTETLLDLKKGSIFGSVKKQAAASRFEVKIPNGVAGIRGTIFLIKASGLVSCLQGSVVAAYTTSAGDVNTQVVGAGQEFNCATGQGNPMSGSTSSSMSAILNDSSYSSQASGPRGSRGRPSNYVSVPVSNSNPSTPSSTPPPQN